MMVVLMLVIALIVSLLLNGFTAWLNHKEKRELHIRLASKSLAEAEYYIEQLPRAVKRQDEKQKQEIKEEKNMTKEQREIRDKAKGF